MGQTKRENYTEWDFEFRRESNRLADLDYAIRSHVIQEPLEVEDENRWKLIDEHLLARLASARWTELNRLRVRDPYECVFYGLHRFVLLDVSHKDICVE